jgi:hypothetical protein
MLVGMVQKLVAEREQPFVKTSPTRERFELPLLEARLEAFETTLQKVFFVVVMLVKRRPAYIRSVDDLLYRDRVKCLFLNQGQQRLLKEVMRPLDAAVRLLFHLCLPQFSDVGRPFVQIGTQYVLLSGTPPETWTSYPIVNNVFVNF